MKLFNPEDLKNYLRARNLKPKDYMGQNFLIDEEVLNQIVETADLKSTDTVLEVGPGLGVLTEELIKRAGKVIAVEKDTKLFEILEHYSFDVGAVRIGKRLMSEVPINAGRKTIRAALPNNVLTLVNQDILRFNLPENIQGPYKVVANIPYYLTSKLFQYFLEQKNTPQLMVLMVQKEVGERVVATAGNLSVLGISVQIYADVEIVRVVSRDCFWPAPKVDSVILKITPKDKYPKIKDKKLFFQIIKVAFAGKRKQIKNSLSAYSLELIVKAGIDPKTRPQDLSIEQWIVLYERIAGSVQRGV